MIFNKEMITQDSVLKTRQFFIDVANGSIEEAKKGTVFVNNLDSYIKWNQEKIKNIKEGKSDHTFTFLQRAYFIQTGKCLGLLGDN